MKSFYLFLCSAIYSFLSIHQANAEVMATQSLQDVQVTAKNRSNKTEHHQKYTISAMKTTTGLALSSTETPQSVSVLTQTQLKDQGINTMADALKTTTGVNVVADSGQYRYFSRGFAINQIEEDGLAVTVSGGADGNIYRDAQSMNDLAIYDHIEVVRGATGLTQANSDPSGTINAVRKKPTAKPQANATISFNRFGNIRAMGDVSGSLNQAKTLRGRAVVVGERNRSFQDDVRGHLGLLYGVIQADVDDHTQLTAGAMYQHQHGTPDHWGIPLRSDARLPALSRDAYMGYDWTNTKNQKFNLFAEAEHVFDNQWKWTGKINYIHNQSDKRLGAIYNSAISYQGLVSGSTLSTQNMLRYQNQGKQLTAQMNVNGQYRLFNRKHDAFMGYHYSSEQSDTTYQRIRNSTAFDPWTFQGNELPEPNWANYDDRVFYDNKTKSHALMLGTRFHLHDFWHILAGGRYTHWRGETGTDYDWWNGKPDTDADQRLSTSQHRFIPYLGINYDFAPNQSLYASYTSIFKPQSASKKDINGNILKPIMGHNYELGWKGEWFNNTLNTAIAFFQVEQRNRPIAQTTTDINDKKINYFESLGKVVSRGIDAEISGQLSHNWRLFAGYTLNNSQYKQTESSTLTKGSHFSSFTPRHLLRIYTRYVLPFDQRKWTIGGGVSVQSAATSLYNIRQGGYALWNANVQYQASKHLNFSLIGHNLTNKHYFENNRVRTHGLNNFYGEPRNITAKISYQW